MPQGLLTSTDRALPEGIELRRATHADNAAVLEFVARRSMRAGLGLRFDRSPDFFALHEAHGGTHETWLLLENERIVGLGSIVVRCGYVAGRPEPVAYLAELRISPRRKAAGLWPRLLAERLAQLGAAAPLRHAYCCIIRANRLARASVLRPRVEPWPRFEHWRGYTTVTLLARKPWRRRARAGHVRVRPAGQRDSERLRCFLDCHARRQALGVVFDAATWQHRLNTWPSFGIERFYLAFDRDSTLVGCLAPWDTAAINRIVIERMPPSAALLRLAHNVLTPLSGKPAIASGGSAPLPDIALTHVCIENRDPDVFAALLDAAYRDIAATGRYATTSLCLYEPDPLRPALSSFWHHAIAMDLFRLALDPAAPPFDRSALPGFEHYLV